MVILWDSLKAGQTDKVVRFTRQNKDPAFAKLMSVISDSVSNGELGTASIIVFLAAGFAYQNTVDYYMDLRTYLDRFDNPKRTGFHLDAQRVRQAVQDGWRISTDR